MQYALVMFLNLSISLFARLDQISTDYFDYPLLKKTLDIKLNVKTIKISHLL